MKFGPYSRRSGGSPRRSPLFRAKATRTLRRRVPSGHADSGPSKKGAVMFTVLWNFYTDLMNYIYTVIF
ncbi:Uncharacterised protein [Mycobacteroides abscessus subsp. abscessus]|nr:Uncharacterised protein [Mycobacteroides abscessus subsp. abscessus]